MDRALGVCFIPFRPTEIAQHAIAYITGDVPTELSDGSRDARLVDVNHLGQVFRIKAPRKRRRIHQVAQHNAKLPAFSSPRGFGRRREWLRQARAASGAESRPWRHDFTACRTLNRQRAAARRTEAGTFRRFLAAYQALHPGSFLVRLAAIPQPTLPHQPTDPCNNAPCTPLPP